MLALQVGNTLSDLTEATGQPTQLSERVQHSVELQPTATLSKPTKSALGDAKLGDFCYINVIARFAKIDNRMRSLQVDTQSVGWSPFSASVRLLPKLLCLCFTSNVRVATAHSRA